MAVNVSTVDNTTRACVAARADGPDGVRPGSSAAAGLEDESGLAFASGVADDGDSPVVGDSGPDRHAALACDRAVDGVEPAARIGNRSRRLAMITALSPSVSRQDRPLLATGVASATGAGTDTSITTDTDIAAREGTDGSPAVREADGVASTLAATGTDTETATGDGTGTTATRRPSHSSTR